MTISMSKDTDDYSQASAPIIAPGRVSNPPKGLQTLPGHVAGDLVALFKLLADDTPQGLVARSRYHNAVSLVVAEPQKVASALSELPEVAKAEIREGELTLFPTGGQDIFEAITAAVKQNNWDLQGMRYEAGRLDEVFHDITRGGTAT